MANRKISQEKVDSIMEMLRQGTKVMMIVKKTGVCKSTVHNLRISNGLYSSSQAKVHKLNADGTPAETTYSIYKRRQAALSVPKPDTNLIPERCAGCGGLVYMPCLKCFYENRQVS